MIRTVKMRQKQPVSPTLRYDLRKSCRCLKWKLFLVRACRNAIEFNSIPSIKRLVPGGYDSLKLDVLLAVPSKYRDTLDLNKVKDVFPYGSVQFQIQDGGMIAPSGIAIDDLGDKNDDMVVVCSSVTVGH